MKINDEWKDYRVIATGDGEKLERWGEYTLLRPDPQVIWKADKPLADYKGIDARYIRSSSGGGRWEYYSQIPDEWTIGWRNLRFLIKPMGFKHTGLFPEQAANWALMTDIIQKAKVTRSSPIRVLNLFAYTGAATVACAAAGASVCHVDSAKAMVTRAGQNAQLSGLSNAPIRYIVDDCKKFIRRELNRQSCYDAIIMDPPSFGRGPNGELWKIEDDIFDFVDLAVKILSDNPLFVLINSYTTGLQPSVMRNILSFHANRFKKPNLEAYEVCLPVEQGELVLPCGASALLSNLS
ncbi:MAG: class I SAM-dependent methyltransferase [Clostridia bacterium]|nr:class I SAM-dependent methyltransferase [Clostridia bacterium]